MNDRRMIIKMTETATGKVTYVTPRGNAKARGKAHLYPTANAQRIADGFAADEGNAGFTFTVEEV